MTEAKTTEVKHIFIDIENYTYNRSVEAQSDLIFFLNQYVLESLDIHGIKSEDRILIPTGDGMCISLLNISNPFDIHISIALNILAKIKLHNSNQDNEMRKFRIRVGINENIDNLITDINGNRNISGSGINFAARIESLCDGNQILVGNSVYEKLVQREKYMKSFSSYSAKVKHGIELNVHQYINDDLDFLNNSTPTKFRPTARRAFRLTEIQAYYLANCLVHENFISQNIGSGQNSYSLQTLLLQLSEDCYARTRVTKANPKPRQKVSRAIQEHFDYIQKIDFWIICDFASYLRREYFAPMLGLFSDPFLFVNDKGKDQIQRDYPEIFKEFQLGK